MKKNDIKLIGVIAFLALALFVFLRVAEHSGTFAVISVEGIEVERLPLDTDTRYLIRGVGGENLLVIENDEAYLLDADCPDKLCVKMGHISKTGQSIICLPHKVVVEIEGGSDADVDVMVQ